MATLVLSAAGAALGSGFGGTVLGLSGAVIGRAIGATLGRAIDQRILGGGGAAVETGRIDRLRLTNAGEGAPVPRLWGRMRVGGQVIWATRFQEHASRHGGGKGNPTVTQYSYSVSLALGLCEGEILGIGRIWADGSEIAARDLTLRVYSGSRDQLPDPKIAATEGADQAPAYRGLAYAVIEDLDLSPYGNRVPQLTFEVIRPAQPADMSDEGVCLHQAVRAVAMIPGTGEYALATTPVWHRFGPGEARAVNLNTPSGKTDFATSLDQLATELPAVGSISLVVSWFGDDLDCSRCRIRPRVEQHQTEGEGMTWRAGGLSRDMAGLVPQKEGRPIYGGTPSDQSVIEAIRAIRAGGREVMFYPFILMEQGEDNQLINPLTGSAPQPVMPWRGRIGLSLAPGIAGSPDRTAAAADEVAAFFGNAMPGDFGLAEAHVEYHGSAEDWGFRRFILHCAQLCRLAGGVDAFCIGSEMVGLTRIRDDGDGFPAVTALRQLAAEVRAILGPGCKLSYAADWTEYGSHSADGNLYFPLDPLWADPVIDFIGIDNYMPLADWREGELHRDAGWGTIHHLGYLQSNILGGEGYDWYYDSPEGEAAQIRLPITDHAHGESWVYRIKDLKSWWSRPHHHRTGAVRHEDPTAWLPGAKPIRFTEYGCAAIDKGANQPNRFIDLYSSESRLPRASTGRRDDLMQMQYLRAIHGFWNDPANNPAAQLYAGRMIDMEHAHAWAWDARPFPAFPARSDLWADAGVYRAGHWLNGRATGQPLDAVLREIGRDLAPDVMRTDAAPGVVRGYLVDRVQSGRADLQPLMLAHGLDAADREGQLHFMRRQPGTDHRVNPDTLALTEGLEGLTEFTRQAEPESVAGLRLAYVEAEGDYTVRMAEAHFPDQPGAGVSVTELPMSLTAGEAGAMTARWLAEARIARDSIRLSLPPSLRHVGAGHRLLMPDGGEYRIEQVEDTGPRRIDAVRIEGGLYLGAPEDEAPLPVRPFVAPGPVHAVFLDLPLLTGAEIPHQPFVAVTARPWSAPAAVWSAPADSGFSLNRLVPAAAVIGTTETDLTAARPGLWDRGPALRLRLIRGSLGSQTASSVLAGANMMAIGGNGGGGNSPDWEVFQFANAELVAPRSWDVSLRLRGQLGTDGVMPTVWPAGSTVVLLDPALLQLDLPPSLRGVSQSYRIGLFGRGLDDPHVIRRQLAFDGIGLRPYPVAHLRAKPLAGGFAFSWVRRSRIDGDPWQQPEVPLGEEREAYLLRILVEGDIRREVELEQPFFEYGAAMRLADAGSGGFEVAVSQISARFGTGPFRRLTLG